MERRAVTEDVRIVTGTFEKSASALGYSIIAAPKVSGLGNIYPAIHDASSERVVLKALETGFDEARLWRDARILKTIEHPGVVSFRDLVKIDGVSTVVAEWVEGDSLARVIEERRHLPLNEVQSMVDQLSSALDAVHARGVVHRELSPASIVVQPSSNGGGSTLRISDFGVSRASDSDLVSPDGSEHALERYVAPETLDGGRPQAQADQYALAVIAQELLTGRWPFPETDAFVAPAHHHLHTAPTPVRELLPALPHHVEGSLLRALDKDPDNRFSTLAEFADSLRGIEVASAADAPKKRRTRWTARQQLGAAVALLAGLLIGGLLASMRASGNPAEATAPAAASDIARDAQEPEVSDVVPTDGADRLALPTRPAGFAASLECNLVIEADFDTAELPRNFYLLPENPSREVAVPGAGVDGSGALEIGDPGSFGAYGEVVAIDANEQYVVSVHTRIDGVVASSDVRVEWLDAQFQTVGESASLDILARPSGQHALITEPAPPEAQFGVPRMFKGEGTGVLFVDELVFARANSECVDALLEPQ